MRMRMFPLGSEIPPGPTNAKTDNNNGKPDDNATGGKFGLTLLMWALVQAVITLILTISVGTITAMQMTSSTSSNIKTGRLNTPITLSAGLWVNAATMKEHKFDDLIFGNGITMPESCKLYGYASSPSSTMYIRPIIFSVNVTHNGLLVIMYYVLALIFQVRNVLQWSEYDLRFKEGRNSLMGIVEQIFTSPFMIATLYLQQGITDISTLINAAANMFAFGVLQLLGEALFEGNTENDSIQISKKGTIPFFAVANISGWFALIFAFAPLIINLIKSNECTPASDMFTKLITILVILEMVCFTVTQIIQAASMVLKERPKTDDKSSRIDHAYNIEFANIIVNMISKIAFCTLLYIANLT